jgi:hypothetical protein
MSNLTPYQAEYQAEYTLPGHPQLTERILKVQEDLMGINITFNEYEQGDIYVVEGRTTVGNRILQERVYLTQDLINSSALDHIAYTKNRIKHDLRRRRSSQLNAQWRHRYNPFSISTSGIGRQLMEVQDLPSPNYPLDCLGMRPQETKNKQKFEDVNWKIEGF